MDSEYLEAIEGEVRSEPLNRNFSVLADRLKNAKASVSAFESLPTDGNEVGDYRLVTGGSQAGQLFWWDGDAWQGLKQDARGVIVNNSSLTDILDSLQMEIGSSGDGEFVRYNNGLQICWGIIDYSVISFSETGRDIYISDTLSWQFPRQFISPAVVTVDPNKTNVWGTRSSSEAVESVNFRLLSATVADKTDVIVHVFAVGRWK